MAAKRKRYGAEEIIGSEPAPVSRTVRRQDEKEHGEYRTKRLILERYDELAQATATGTAYQTVLDPAPADPRVAHPGWERMVLSELRARPRFRP